MEIRTDIEEFYTLVTPVGEVGEKGAEQLGRFLEILLRRGYGRVVLDFNEVPSISAGVPGLLVEWLGRARFGAGELKIAGLNGSLRYLFGCMGVDSMFEIDRTVVEAVASLGRCAKPSV